MKPIGAQAAVRRIWLGLGLPPDALGQLELTGADPVLPSSLAIGTAAQASVAASALAAAHLWRARGGKQQSVAVDMEHAALTFQAEHHLRVDGRSPELWGPLTGAYRCRDDRWVRVHANYPHHQAALTRLLRCDVDRPSVAKALSAWSAAAFEDAAASAGLAAARVRAFEEWDASGQGLAVARQPLVRLRRIGEGAPLAAGGAASPLEGFRVLDLTRVVAGPLTTRLLAGFGADVLAISSPAFPESAVAAIANSRGKRSAQLDLDLGADRDRLRMLVKAADVFVQSYRPGALALRGFGPEAVAALRPGIVYASITAFGASGPWALRRGFDSIVQAAAGLNLAEAEAFGDPFPRPLPCQALDHASGHLLALGTMAALARRAEFGGSWLVDVSLARTALWLRGLGQDRAFTRCPGPPLEQATKLLHEVESPFGLLSLIRDAAVLERTPVSWRRPPAPPGSHPAAW